VTGPAQDGVDRLNADFQPPWHVWLSVPSQGCRSRVWAARAFPTHPHADADPDLSRQFTGSGETVDADTPAGMRKLLEERS
jgi:hypothetical protein